MIWIKQSSRTRRRSRISRIVLGTRPSKLALIQTELVREKLEKLGIEVSVKTRVSKGDKERHSPLYKMNSVGIFVEELNNLILSGEIDAAVHSAKDIPSSINDGLRISAVLERGPVEDVLISENPMESLPPGSVIGTSSIRRIYELKSVRNDLIVKDVRGNIDTRIEKLKRGEYNGIIVARAATERMSVPQKSQILDRNTFIPAPNQGIIAIVSKRNSEVDGILERINDRATYSNMVHERMIVENLNLGCSVPVGILSENIGDKFVIRIRFYSLKGSDFREYEKIFDNGQELTDLVKDIKDDLPDSYGYEFV